MSAERFSSTFPTPDLAAWRSLVDAVLKGRDFDRTLVSRSADGIAIAPLYPKAQGTPLAGRSASQPWHVLTRVDLPDSAAANAQALEDLANGASGLHLVFAGSVGAAGGFGLGSGAAEAVDRALDGVVLEAGIRLELDLSLACKDAAEAVAARVERQKLDPASVDVGFGYDPLGQMALLAGNPVAWTELAPYFAQLAGAMAERGLGGQIVSADGRLVHAAGGTEAQELAFALTSALAYWRALEAGGLDLDRARRMIQFRLAADADQFLTIAKFRALRRLWALVEEEAGLAPAPIHLTGETAWRMMTRRDPWVNLLRATVAVFAAGVGGANAVSVIPFTSAIGLADGFARRLARNTQLVLLAESNLHRVADPAAGAGGLDALTEELAGKAWSLVQEIEAAGGLDAALAAGTVQARIAESRRARESAVAMRKAPITGTSEFPAIDEAPVAVLAPAPAPAPVPAGRFEALAAHRLAEPFERLRDAAEAAPTPPSVFLATLGPLAAFTARATFAKNLFEAGGLRAPLGEGFAAGDGTDVAALVAAFKASGTTLACLCGTDETYAADGAAVASALVAAGARHVVLAGRPGEAEAALRAAGVSDFVFVGCDTLAALRWVHAAAGL